MPSLRPLQSQPFRPAWNARSLLSAVHHVHHARSFVSSSGNGPNNGDNGTGSNAAKGEPHSGRKPLIRHVEHNPRTKSRAQSGSKPLIRTVVMGTGKHRPDEQTPLNQRRRKHKPRSDPADSQPAKVLSASDQRLNELETLLNQARTQLAELQKDKPEQGHNDRIPTFGKDVSKEWHLPKFSEDQVHPKETNEAKKDSGSEDGSGIRYLSKQPGKPLPHTKADAIPQSLRGSQPFPPADQQDHHKSLAEELFPEEPKTDDSQAGPHRQRKTDSEAKSPKLALRDFIPARDSRGSRESRASEVAETEAEGSLLPELFPELAAERKAEEMKTQPEREVPRLRLEADMEEQPQPARKSLTQQYMEKIEATAAEKLVVLCLYGASKHLSEEDFRRVLPPSQHVEGWAGPGEFIKVIPQRDEITLEQLDRYYIVFPNAESARIYQGCAYRFHEMASQHTPTSLTSPLATPPDVDQVLGTKKNMHHAITSFTINLGTPLNLHLIPQPYFPHFARFLHRGGYENVALSPHDKDIGARVLFRLDGAQPSLWDLQRALQHDSRNRGKPWRITTAPDGPKGVIKLDLTSRNEAVGEDGSPTLLRRTAPRYVINFENKAEAVRFVKDWHRRPFQWDPNGAYENGEDAPIARAELLW
ncbi:uncharacterized protein K452DRAFT_316093 [Aplosporella prunicola CBS 121167]|uniref:Uncharacterized protein n=1 Tax=Aplosporella prunicola CBS 121167 TaxID=1176127 RepID=A0A6A6BNF5_9PEZI|nr:uncharacterized protein K452DRAFT_316093 [Aplosporella prunicola CBS 121167]KAF2144953.1 hypothetical protein K452DRAFT_316093 [Aplosporella prunicola CBS 121167]